MSSAADVDKSLDAFEQLLKGFCPAGALFVVCPCIVMCARMGGVESVGALHMVSIFQSSGLPAANLLELGFNSGRVAVRLPPA